MELSFYIVLVIWEVDFGLLVKSLFMLKLLVVELIELL